MKTEYLNTPYEESACYKSTEYCNDIEILERRLMHINSALRFHIEEENESQVIFFTLAKNHTEQKIKKIKKVAEKALGVVAGVL